MEDESAAAEQKEDVENTVTENTDTSDSSGLIERGRSTLARYCSEEAWKQRLPILSWASSYQLEYLFYDVLSAVITAFTEIPQALAYAAIAGLSYEYGLYTGVLSSVVYGVFGSCKDVSIGPNVLVALIISNFSVVPLGYFILQDPKFVVLLTFCSGIIQIALAVTRLGAVASFISSSVSIGFANAAGVLIIISQIKYFLGLSFHASSVVDEVGLIIGNIGNTNIWDIVVGMMSLLLLILLNKVASDVRQWQDKKDSLNLSSWQLSCLRILWIISLARIILVVYTATFVTWILHNQGHDGYVGIVGNVTAGITFETPEITNLEAFQAISVALIVIPLMTFVLDYSVAKKYGRIGSYKVKDNQEFFALGFCNLIGSFVSSFPVTASSIRSSIMHQAEVKTGLSSIITGGILFVAILFLTPVMEFIPLATLAAVVLVSVYPYIRLTAFRMIWRVNKVDLIPALTTYICSLFVDVVYGILIGIAVDLVILLLPIARPHFTMTITYSGKNQVTAANPFAAPAYVIQVESSVKYPAGDFLAEYLYDMTLSPDYVRPIILDFTHVSRLDITAVEYLGQALQDFHKVGSQLIFVNVQPLVYVQLTSANLEHIILAGSTEEAMDIINEDIGDA